MNFGLSWTDVTSSLTNIDSYLDTIDCIGGAFLDNFIDLTTPPSGSLFGNHVAALVRNFNEGVVNLYTSSDAFTSSSSAISSSQFDNLGLKKARKRTFCVSQDFTRFYIGGTNYGFIDYNLSSNSFTSTLAIITNNSIPPHDDHLVGMKSIHNIYSNQVILGTDGGLEISNDNGSSFSNVSFGMSTMQLYSVAVSMKRKAVSCGSVDNASPLYMSDFWFSPSSFGDGEDVAINYNGADVVYEDDFFNNQFQVTNFNDATPVTVGSVLNFSNFCRYDIAPMEPQPLLYNELYYAKPNSDDFKVGKINISGGSSSYYSFFPNINYSECGSECLQFAKNRSEVSALGLSRQNINKIYAGTVGYYKDSNGCIADANCTSEASCTGSFNYSDMLTKKHRTFWQFDGTIWSDRSPELTGVNGDISGIAVSPYNDEHVWICWRGFENYNGSNQNVYFSASGGAPGTWVAQNTGLPKVPSHKIIFDESSQDRLFLATNEGVYVKEGVGNWQLYGNGLPNVIVHDIDIDYCREKIYVATWGRSIWEADLVVPGSPGLHMVSGVEIWDFDRTMMRDVVVPAGAKLVINNNAVINFAKGKGIVVDQGGRLEVDHATLTNLCGEEWSGISVKGYPYGEPRLASLR